MNLQKQKLLIEYIISNDDIFTSTNNIIDEFYFDPEYRASINFIKTYYEQYKAAPLPEQILAETGEEFKTHEIDKSIRDYAIDEIETFCKNKAIEHAILQGPKLLADQNYGEIEQKIKDAISIGISRDIGIDYFTDPETRLKRMLMNQNSIPTGWTDLDIHLNGGINRKELLLFMASSGVGKSILMSNLAVNCVLSKYNVLYITLELAEEVVAKRFDSMFTGIAQSNIFSRITEISSKLTQVLEDSGNLIIKRMPESTTNANDIRAYLKEFEIINGYIPDIIIIDYLDLMTSNHKISAENLFVKDKYIAEEVRSIGNDYDATMVSASQMGRAAGETEDHNQAHIQGGISKVNTTDNLIAIVQTEAMKAAGEYILKLVKTRSSGAAGKKVLLKWDPVSLRVSNFNDESKKIDFVKQTESEQSKPDLSSLMKI